MPTPWRGTSRQRPSGRAFHASAPPGRCLEARSTLHDDASLSRGRVGGPSSHGVLEGKPGRNGFRTWSRRFAGVWEPTLVILAVFGLGQALIASGLVSSSAIPLPSAVVGALFQDVQQTDVWSGLGATLAAWAIGLGAVIVVGVPIGMLLGLNRVAYRATQPTLEFIRTVPSIAALPLLILILGISLRLAVVMVFAGALWPVLIQTMYGVRDVDPVAKQVGRAYGLTPLQILFRIVLPSSLPYVATGLRLASLIALLLSVSASLLAGGQGIGYLIGAALAAGEPALMYGRVVLLGLAGLAISLGVSALEKRILFWHTSHRRVLT